MPVLSLHRSRARLFIANELTTNDLSTVGEQSYRYFTSLGHWPLHFSQALTGVPARSTSSFRPFMSIILSMSSSMMSLSFSLHMPMR